MIRLSVIFSFIILFLLTGLCLAGIPQLINYQGMLTDNSGTPLNGTYSIAFKIFNAESDGMEKWEETQSSVSVANGLFNVILGSVTPIELDFSEDYWLDITVGGEQMPSRLKFTSVGYAYRAQWSDTANYARATGGESVSPWRFRVTDGNDTTVITSSRWGVARYGCTLYGNADSTHVNLGNFSVTGESGQNYKYCTVGGGYFNYASGISAVVGGGNSNTASGEYATVGGGRSNTADTTNATVGGGDRNIASGYTATVGGGHSNQADTNYATVGGGYNNTASGYSATVGGGNHNITSGYSAIVGGGFDNTASGAYATVAGGSDNTAGGSYSFAAGRRAKANHLGTFVWADSSVNADFASTGNHQFLIRASGGVGIGTNSPDERLHIENSEDGSRSFLQIETSHASNWGETGLRIKTPQNTWHLRSDDATNNNIPDGSLGLRSQDLGSEVMVWTENGRVGDRNDKSRYEISRIRAYQHHQLQLCEGQHCHG